MNDLLLNDVAHHRLADLRRSARERRLAMLARRATGSVRSQAAARPRLPRPRSAGWFVAEHENR